MGGTYLISNSVGWHSNLVFATLMTSWTAPLRNKLLSHKNPDHIKFPLHPQSLQHLWCLSSLLVGYETVPERTSTDSWEFAFIFQPHRDPLYGLLTHFHHRKKWNSSCRDGVPSNTGGWTVMFLNTTMTTLHRFKCVPQILWVKIHIFNLLFWIHYLFLTDIWQFCGIFSAGCKPLS